MYFPDFSKAIIQLFWLAVIMFPLALWKVIDIVIWLFTHISIDWK